MQVVLDSNILFSALISPHGAPNTIDCTWRAARFEVVTSRIPLDEIHRAGPYPKLQAILQPAKIGVMIHDLQRGRLSPSSVRRRGNWPKGSFSRLYASYAAGRLRHRPLYRTGQPDVSAAPVPD